MSQNILVIGAGRSASSLIRFLLSNAQANDWTIRVADVSLELAKEKIAAHPCGRALVFDATNSDQRKKEISESSIVVSMLPATMHSEVARDCLALKKHLVTASYVSPAMKEMDKASKDAGILFLNECGLDPGIDHMSAMKIIHEEKLKGNKIRSFKSYCGGLVTPESNDNPWGYKFTWNPRNVVLAGQGGDAHFRKTGELHSISYERLFTETELVDVDGAGLFDAYANRDSLSYIEPYGLGDVETMLRGTLREKGFCLGWNEIIKLGLTNDRDEIPKGIKTWKALLSSLNVSYDGFPADVKVKMEWLGIHTDLALNSLAVTPAQALQYLLEDKWKLKAGDKDRIVMKHEFIVETPHGEGKSIQASLIVDGKDQIETAMSMTVGFPLAIATKLILQNVIQLTGVRIPTEQQIYEPVLKELEECGIVFKETEKKLEKARKS